MAYFSENMVERAASRIDRCKTDALSDVMTKHLHSKHEAIIFKQYKKHRVLSINKTIQLEAAID